LVEDDLEENTILYDIGDDDEDLGTISKRKRRRSKTSRDEQDEEENDGSVDIDGEIGKEEVKEEILRDDYYKEEGDVDKEESFINVGEEFSHLMKEGWMHKRSGFIV